MKNRLFPTVAVLALVGFAACGGEGGEGEAPDAVLTDTITQPTTETVQVPAVDTAVVQQQINIDTTVQTDTTQADQNNQDGR